MALAQESHRTCTSSPLTYLLGDPLISIEVCPAEATQPSRSLRWPLEVERATCPLKARVCVGGPGKGSATPPASVVPEPQGPQRHASSSCPQGGSKTSFCSPGRLSSWQQGAQQPTASHRFPSSLRRRGTLRCPPCPRWPKATPTTCHSRWRPAGLLTVQVSGAVPETP